MLRKKCRSVREAQLMRQGIAEAMRHINSGIYLETEDPSDNCFSFLGPIKPEFVSFLKTLTGTESLEEVFTVIGIRTLSEKGRPETATPVWILKLNPTYREAIRLKLEEWEDELARKEEYMQRLEGDRPAGGYAGPTHAGLSS